MKPLLALACFAAFSQGPPATQSAPAPKKAQPAIDLSAKWIHGAEHCETCTDPAIQAHRASEDTWIFRESKCVHFEAPFLYLLLGDRRALLVDTGATKSETAFPLRAAVREKIDDWCKRRGLESIELVVAHSHAHGDHVAGDDQFRGQPHTTVLGRKPEDVARYFGIGAWPEQTVTFDLGGRALQIVPIPGHEAAHIAVFDERTGILLTGDTLYPGRLYVRDWGAYRASVARLAEFVRGHKVAHVLGAHVEMSDQPGVDYPQGATFQPHEHALELAPAQVFELERAIGAMGDSPSRETHPDFIVWPH